MLRSKTIMQIETVKYCTTCDVSRLCKHFGCKKDRAHMKPKNLDSCAQDFQEIFMLASCVNCGKHYFEPKMFIMHF